MNTENNALLRNDVETNVSEEEITLAPPVELFDEAKEIAQSTLSDEKFPFTLYASARLQPERIPTVYARSSRCYRGE